MNPGIFCCHPFKNGWKLVVLLLLSNFSASFSLLLAVPRYQKLRKTSCFLRLFSNFLRSFSRIVTNFRFFQKFLKKNLKNWNFLKKMWLQRFSAATHSKMDENWLFCCCFQNVQLVFHYFWQFPGTKSCGKLGVSLLFSNFLRCFSRIVTNFRFFQKFLKKKITFLKNLWIQNFFAASHSKMDEGFAQKTEKIEIFWKNCDSRNFLLQPIQKWMKTGCFAAAFKMFS